MTKDEMGNGQPAFNLDRNMHRFYVDKEGDVNVYNQNWVRLGNIHEKDILNRIKKSVRKSG